MAKQLKVNTQAQKQIKKEQALLALSDDNRLRFNGHARPHAIRAALCEDAGLAKRVRRLDDFIHGLPRHWTQP